MNARDDAAVGRFWAEALGWSISSEEPGVTNLEPAGFTYPGPVAVCIDVIAVPEPKTVKNRVHLDLATTSAAHQAALVTRCCAPPRTSDRISNTQATIKRQRQPGSGRSAPPTSTSAKATSRGRAWPIRRENEFDVLTPR